MRYDQQNNTCTIDASLSGRLSHRQCNQSLARDVEMAVFLLCQVEHLVSVDSPPFKTRRTKSPLGGALAPFFLPLSHASLPGARCQQKEAKNSSIRSSVLPWYFQDLLIALHMARCFIALMAL